MNPPDSRTQWFFSTFGTVFSTLSLCEKFLGNCERRSWHSLWSTREHEQFSDRISLSRWMHASVSFFKQFVSDPCHQITFEDLTQSTQSQNLVSCQGQHLLQGEAPGAHVGGTIFFFCDNSTLNLRHRVSYKTFSCSLKFPCPTHLCVCVRVVILVTQCCEQPVFQTPLRECFYGLLRVKVSHVRAPQSDSVSDHIWENLLRSAHRKKKLGLFVESCVHCVTGPMWIS